MTPWLDWGSFWFGVLCAYTVPYLGLGMLLGIGLIWRRHRARAVVNALLREVAPSTTREAR